MIGPKVQRTDSLPAAKRVVRARSGSMCERCGLRGDVEFHHRKFRSRGGLHTPENGIDLCGWGNTSGCHGWAHGDIDAHRRGYAIPGWITAEKVADVPIFRVLPGGGIGWALQRGAEVVPISEQFAGAQMRRLGIWRRGESA